MTKTDKLNRLALAANALRRAAEALQQVQEDKSDNHYLCEDARYYRESILTLISCDHGEAGIDALIRKVSHQLEG